MGDWFTESLGWRWAFWMNLPLGALAITSTAIVPVMTWGGTLHDWDSLNIIGLIALAYMPIYLQMVTGVNATQRGCR
ncbi:hypothetical protein FB472_2503 [Rhodoglobus vestalii]|uniref:MFS transporter n=1 Tax=Rhodoglobus vestalii TaxID=193384 RepID=A0A8H2K6P8_9MICO|nr:hypothetical protein FB472_2503 [Rhodoglobus vestalii]